MAATEPMAESAHYGQAVGVGQEDTRYGAVTPWPSLLHDLDEVRAPVAGEDVIGARCLYLGDIGRKVLGEDGMELGAHDWVPAPPV